MPYHYLLFDFDLPYGEKLPVITPITKDEETWLKTLNSSNYTDDDYISLDGSYMSLTNIINSLTIIKLPQPLPINRQDHIIDAIKQATNDPIKLQKAADPNAKNACPTCQSTLDDNNHCNHCVTLAFPENIRPENQSFIEELIDITGFTDSTSTVTHDRVTINSINQQSGKPQIQELKSHPYYFYNDTHYCLYYYVKAEKIDIKRIYRPNEKNDLLKITITERKLKQ